ncbi:hypothetical protein EGW08_011356, partial [Elysia chlorotica]
MADSNSGENSPISRDLELSDPGQKLLRPSDSTSAAASASSSKTSYSSSSFSSSSSSSFSVSSSSSQSQCSSSSASSATSQSTVKYRTSMLYAEDPGPVRRKSLDLGKSTEPDAPGRRRHNTDMDEMEEELMRPVADGEDAVLGESASSLSSTQSSSGEASPSQAAIQRIASSSSLRKSGASDPYKALERSQSDASLMRDLILLDAEDVHLTAAESSSGQNISECNRVYLDLSRAEAFEKV